MRDLMRSPMLCGASGGETPRDGQVDRVVLRITDGDVNEAISLSVALKRPDRSFGAIIASRASSLTDGSARVYISVVCMCAWPSQRETLRRSIFGCLQDPKRAGMPQRMRGDPPVGQRRAAASSGPHVLVEDVFKTGTRHGFAMRVQEQFRNRDWVPDCHPRTQCRCSLLP